VGGSTTQVVSAKGAFVVELSKRVTRDRRHRWKLSLTLGEEAGSALFQRISHAIIAEIQRGRLRRGDRLPGSRTLAESLLVNRNTVLAAYAELQGEGWIESSRASGTFVSRSLPELQPRDFAGRAARRRDVPSRAGFDVSPAPGASDLPAATPEGVPLSSGSPDVRLAPATLLARAFRRAVRKQSGTALRYGFPHGHPELRAALARMLTATRGLTTTPEDVVVTSGSQMALDLVSRALLRPGDCVAIEQIGYRPAWLAFQQHGAKLIPIPVDDKGLDVDALASVAEHTPIRAVYVTPHHQYPTTATLSAGRRIALLELARRLRIAVIEDDYDHEYHYDGRPVLPMASADRAGVVVYVGTLAKIVAPGVRLGYLVGPRPLLESVAAHRHCLDRQGDHSLECAVAELLEHGDVQRHARRARRIYQLRRDCAARAMREELGDAVSFTVPPGGISIWTRVASGIDVDAWAARALRRSLVVQTARKYSFDERPRPFFRLGFAALTENEMRHALRELAKAL
jgi:GntR family transcriptional regulator/MocR family aminotransferase